MIEQLVADANAIVDLIRKDRLDPPPLRNAKVVHIPLPAVGELFAGAYSSDRIPENVAKVEEILTLWPVLHPDVATSRIYGRLRGISVDITAARRNDLWIAALCIQHSLPLLTNDRGFNGIADLTIIYW